MNTIFLTFGISLLIGFMVSIMISFISEEGREEMIRRALFTSLLMTIALLIYWGLQ